MNAVSEYRFPTEKEACKLIEDVSKIFKALGIEIPAPIVPKDFAQILFTLSPDAFGGELENAERWLEACIDKVEEDNAEKERIRLLADFPITTMH